MNMLKRFLVLMTVSVISTTLSVSVAAESRDERKGRKAHERLSQFTHYYDDKAINDYINEIGQKLVTHTHGDWPEYKFRFFVVDSPAINAFAADGGYIYINRGLLSYMTSEAQLAAVLAHEIAHVTKRHLARQRGQQRLGNTAAFIASLALLNGNVGEALRLENAARVSGFGRDMELEADEYGASYLYNAGYDPNALIEVLGILKDHQTFSAKSVGGSGVTYHGVFSTHPRNDQRLREVVQQAGTLPPGEAFVGREKYRAMIDGLVFGENDNSIAPPGFERYASRGLGVTFAYPDEWERSTEGQNIVLTAPDGTKMMIKVARLGDEPQAAENLIINEFKVDGVRDAEAVYQEANVSVLDALMAFIDQNETEKRVAAIKYGANVFYFESIDPSPVTAEADENFVTVIRSFRKAENRDFAPSDVKNVYFRRLEPGETFSELAGQVSLGRDSENFLRLINGFYPDGEPQPGTWIKLVE